MMSAALECASCGSPTSAETSRPVALRCSCHADPHDRRRAHGAYCSEACQEQAIRYGIAHTRRCATCGGNFDPGRHLPDNRVKVSGRPTVYCSDDCQREMEATRSKAIRELAKNKTSYRTTDELVFAVNRAVGLHEFWAGRGPTSPTEPVDVKAKQALRKRIEDLQKELAGRRAAEDAEAAKQIEAGKAEAWRERREAEAEADKEWRDQLLATAK